MVLFDVVIDRGHIPALIAEWRPLVEEFWRFKTYGAPYARGWMEWPAHVRDVLDALNAAEGVRMKAKMPKKD